MSRHLALLSLLVAFPLAAQPDIVGDWSGEIEVTTAQSLTAIFHVSEADSGYAATFDSPDQGAFGLPLSRVAFDGETFSATLDAASASFTGTYDAEGQRIEGAWMQGGRELPLILTPYEASAESAEANKPIEIKPGDYSGDWVGVFAIDNGGEIHMTFSLTRNGDGSYNGVLVAPGQAEDLDLGQIGVYGKEVVINIIGGITNTGQDSFSGTVSDDERTMTGTYAHGGDKKQMMLTRQ